MSTAVDIVSADRMSYTMDMGHYHHSMDDELEDQQFNLQRHTCYRCGSKRFEKFMFYIRFINNQHWLCDYCFEKYGQIEVIQKPALWHHHVSK